MAGNNLIRTRSKFLVLAMIVMVTIIPCAQDQQGYGIWNFNPGAMGLVSQYLIPFKPLQW